LLQFLNPGALVRDSLKRQPSLFDFNQIAGDRAVVITNPVVGSKIANHDDNNALEISEIK
jgi:hypothetical protein